MKQFTSYRADIERAAARMFGGENINGIYPTSTFYTEIDLLIRRAQMEAVGWAYAECCSRLDQGGDPRVVSVPDFFDLQNEAFAAPPEVE